MKKRLIFGIIGSGLLIGAAVYWLIKFVKKDSVNKYNMDLLKEKDSILITSEDLKHENINYLQSVRMQSVNSMSDRHKKAAQVTKESMEKINGNTNLPSQHQNEFDSMFKELEMLSVES